MGLFWRSKAEKEAGNKARITQCLECGGKVSSEAGQCPHCNVKYPNGIRCEICCRKGRLSEGKRAGGDGDNTWVHNSCYTELSKEMQSLKYTCPVCKHTQLNEVGPIKYLNEYYPHFKNPCPKCGHHLTGSDYYPVRCIYCKVFLLPLNANKVNNDYAHRTCYKNRSRSA